MARPIDEKIVAMKMDISDFKKKAMETSGLFAKLKDTLNKVPGVNLSKVKDSLSGITSAAQKVDLSNIAKNVENVAGRFSSLQVMATTALATISAKATIAGGQMLKAFTIDPVMQGFNEYELKMGSIGTMLANTEWAGSTLDDVKVTLEELNNYADQTIYSFAQMTQNIGRFTAAGVTLEDSAVAIKGLGNLAAVSGSDVNQLNTAMYQMSQALAAGKLNLMDWNSMVNAGMGGKKTQDALVATAKAMGKNVDLSDGFRNSIEQGWLTSEVFLETLKKFGKDESMTKAATSVRTFSGMIDSLKESVGSGWATTWELIFGDFEEATERWTGLSQVIGGFFQMQSDSRNRLVKVFADAGIFSGIFAVITNTGMALLKIVQAISSGIGKAFGGTNSGMLTAIGKAMQWFADALIPGEKMLKAISVIFQVLVTPIALVVKGLLLLGKVFVTVLQIPFQLLGLVLKGVMALVGGIASLISSFVEMASSSKFVESVMNAINRGFEALNNGVDSVIRGMKVFSSAVQEAFSILMYGDFTGNGPWAQDSEIVAKLFRIREAVQTFASGVIEAWNILVYGDFTGQGPWAQDSEIVNKLFRIREAVLEFVSGVVEAWNILAYGDFTGQGPWSRDSEIVESLFTIRESMEELGEKAQETWKILTSGNVSSDGPWSENSPIVRGLVKMREGFQNLGQAVSEMNFGALLTPLMAGFGLLYSFITSLDFGKILLPIANGFSRVTGAIADMSFSLEPVINFFGTLFEDIGKGISWIVDAFKKLGSAIKEHLPSGGDLMAGGFVAAIVTVVGFATKLAYDWHQIFKGWGEIGTNVSEVLESTGDALNAFTWQVRANALLTLAIAIGVLAAGFYAFSKMDSNSIATGLYAIIGSLTALIGAMTIMDRYDINGTGMSSVAQIIALSVAFTILAVAMRSMADMNWEDITKGIVGLVGVMGTFAGAVVVMSKFGGSSLAGSAAQFLAIAGTVYLLVLVMEKIADIDGGKIAKGMTGLAVAIGILGGAVIAMSKFGGGKIGASALQLLAISGSVLIMVEAIEQISEIDGGSLATGLFTIGLILGAIAAFTVVTAGKGLLSAGVGISLLAAALTLLVVPIFALGNMSLETLAKGLGALAVVLVAIGAASMLMTGMVAAGAGLILLATAMNMLLVPIMAFSAMPLAALALGIGALAVGILAIGGAAIVIGAGAPALLLGAAGIAALGVALLAAGLGISLFSTGLVTLAAMTGTAVVTIVSFLGTLIVGLMSLIPKAVEFAYTLMIEVAEAFRKHAPRLAETWMEGITKILDVIAENIPKIAEAGTKLITNFLDAMAENQPKIVDSASNMMVTFIESLAETVQRDGPRFTEAIQTLMAEVLIVMVTTGIAVVQALFGWIPGVTEATNEIGESAEETIRDAFGAEKLGEEKGKDFSNALANKTGDAKKAGTKVGDGAETGADSADLKKVGGGLGQDFASGISDKIKNAQTAGTGLANSGKNGASSVQMSGIGVNFAQGFINGISSSGGSVWTAAKNLASKAKNAVTDWLGIHSPSRVMRKDGGWFGEGFALGIADKAKTVGEKAAVLAKIAKESINQFIEGFQLPENDNELRFKAVIDYDKFDERKFGRVSPLVTQPDVSTTRGLVGASKSYIRQNGDSAPTGNVDKSSHVSNTYEIHIESNGTMSKTAMRKMAMDLQAELKSLEDRDRMSRGEEVAF